MVLRLCNFCFCQSLEMSELLNVIGVSAEERRAAGSFAHWEAEGRHPAVPAAVELWAVELGALWSGEGGPERKHAAETRQEQLRQLRYSETSIYTLTVFSLIGVMFYVDDHCSVCVGCRPPLVEWSAGPSSFPASLKAPPPPTQAVITPPTPQEDPMVWEESTAMPLTPTTAQVTPPTRWHHTSAETWLNHMIVRIMMKLKLNFFHNWYILQQCLFLWSCLILSVLYKAL